MIISNNNDKTLLQVWIDIDDMKIFDKYIEKYGYNSRAEFIEILIYELRLKLEDKSDIVQN